jgi:membrane protein DedA with SNARE-associated domain
MKHGPVSIFTGRLVFGIRHYISFPAGLAKMDLKKFIIYTTAGGAIWTSILLGLGYAFGGNEEMLAKALPAIKTALFLAVMAAIFFYIRKSKKQQV